ncbi:3,4-dihydroxy-2-butanone-4-phosphate synthase [Amycolatopsis sp. 3B14]|uniref:3,4-dihydroxy-2-butanone-4-phosphate synthase n=1 Tax=Amycolatopsis sp. 3B14 TaxID=3243600 RepID=UPI003D9669E2
MATEPAVVALPGRRGFDTVQAALDALARGGIVLVVDDEDRENEGDLVMAAEFADARSLAFFVRHTSGFLCVAMPADRADRLDLPPMVPPAANADSHGTAFAVACDAAEGVSTGISAADRARTARMLAAETTRPADLRRPGHVMPLRGRPGGVLERPGHTEATVDLCRLAGLSPVGVLCELVSADGSMARRPELLAFAREHDLPIITIRQLIAHRRRHGLAAVAVTTMPTAEGTFTAHAYRGVDGAEHLALVMGEPDKAPAPLVRVHSECLTGDVFGSQRCDCGAQLRHSLRSVAREGTGVVVYLGGHEGRGIGLTAKMAAYALQERGYDTVDANHELGLPADLRDYTEAAAILHDLGAGRVRLMTNNPAKCAALESGGIGIAERVPMPAAVTPDNIGYLLTKNVRMGHRIAGISETRAYGTAGG